MPTSAAPPPPPDSSSSLATASSSDDQNEENGGGADIEGDNDAKKAAAKPVGNFAWPKPMHDEMPKLKSENYRQGTHRHGKRQKYNEKRHQVL
jgi:hypothetical protein